MCMRCTYYIICGISGCSLPHCSTLSHKRHDFRRKIYWTPNVFWSSLLLLPKNFSSQKDLNEILSSMYIGLNVKYPLFLSYSNERWVFSTDFKKILKYELWRESGQWEPIRCGWTGGQTVETNSCISQFCERASKARKGVSFHTGKARNELVGT
jgi:hypothetical protein